MDQSYDVEVYVCVCIIKMVISMLNFSAGSMFLINILAKSCQLLGSPEDSDLGFLRSDSAKKYVKQLPHVPKRPFSDKFPNVSPLVLDLAEKMLVFDPNKRITGMPTLLDNFVCKYTNINFAI